MSFVERYLAPPAAAQPAAWESITPLLQRRKRPDGSYEFRPTPSFSSPKPTGGPVKQPSTLRTLSDLGSATLGSIPERIKEGWAGFVEMGLNPTPDVAAAFLGAPPRPAPNDLRKGDPGRVFGREGSVLREMREDIREERQEVADQLADVVTAGNLPPAAAAWIDSGAELGSMVVDPTNFIPSAAAVKAGSKIGKPLSFVDNFLPEVAAKTSPELRTARKYNARFGLEDLAPDPDLVTRFPDAAIDSKAFDLAPASPARAVERRGVSGLADPEAARLNEAVRVAQESLPLAEVVPFPARPPVAALPDPLSLPLRPFQEATPDLAPGVSRAIHREAVQGAVEAGERVPPALLEGHPHLSAEVAIPPGAAGAINPEAGFVKLPAGPNFLERFFRHDGEFSSFGDLKGYAFERTKDYRQEIAAGQRSVKTTMRDFSSAFEDEVLRSPDFSGQKPDDVLRYITEGIEGKNDLSGIPPRLRSVSQSIRDHVDLGSDGYLALYGAELPKALRESIEANKGSYFGKTFAAFEDPDFPGLVDPLSPRHDPQERWRWDGYMDWAKRQRDEAAAAPLYRGAAVRTSAGDLGQVKAFDPATGTATVSVTDADGAVSEITFPRQELHNLADNIGSHWTDDDLTAYGQRLLYRDPDAFFGVGQSVVGRESRGNLKRRILQDPRVDDLPTDLATKVNDGQLSLPTAIEQAKTRDGWWSQYLAHAPGLPEELDDLLGLYRDPSMRYRTSQMRAIHDQATFKLHRDLAEKGRGTIFFDAPGAPGNFVRIGGKGPLAEMYTSPERAAVIRGTENQSREAGALLSAWRKVNGGTKLAKTALNFPAGQMRNAAAWPFQLMAGGHFVAAFNPARPVKLLAYQVADKLGTKRGALARMGKRLADTVELADGTRLGERWSMHLDELMPEIEFLYRKGIFGESAGASDLRHYAGAAPAKREPGAISATRKAIRAPVEAGINFWAGGDDLGRHVYFRAELQNEAWAEGLLPASKTIPADYFTRPEWRDVIDAAAKRTALTTPTHSMIAPGIKALRDAPVAPFPGWTAEVFRNAKEQIKLGVSDLRSSNPRRKALGAKRLSGFAATSALASGVIGGMLNDPDVKEPDAVRSFVYPWSRDSQLGVTEVDKSTGKVRWVDLSALIPQAAFMDSVGTILRSASDPTDDSWDAAIDAVQGLVGPFLEEEVVANAVLDWARNKQTGQSTLMKPFQMARHHELSDQGYPVYTEKAAGMTQAKQSAYHFWRSLAPGAALSGERLLRALTEDKPEVRKLFVEMTNYDRDLEVGDELMGWMGLRFATTDVARSMSRMASDYARNRWDAAAMYGRRLGMGADGRAHPEVVLAAKAEANQMGRANHEQLVKIVADAMRLGFTRHQLEGWMKNKAGERQIKESQLEGIFRDARRMIAGQPLQAYIPVIQ